MTATLFSNIHYPPWIKKAPLKDNEVTINKAIDESGYKENTHQIWQEYAKECDILMNRLRSQKADSSIIINQVLPGVLNLNERVQQQAKLTVSAPPSNPMKDVEKAIDSMNVALAQSCEYLQTVLLDNMKSLIYILGEQDTVEKDGKAYIKVDGDPSTFLPPLSPGQYTKLNDGPPAEYGVVRDDNNWWVSHDSSGQAMWKKHINLDKPLTQSQLGQVTSKLTLILFEAKKLLNYACEYLNKRIEKSANLLS